MPTQVIALILCLAIIGTVLSDCNSCTTSGNIYCADTSDCISVDNFNSTTCGTPINVAFNCPTPPRVPYDEEFMRTWMYVIATAAQNENPQLCFDNQLPTLKLYQYRTVNCSADYPDVTCCGYTAFDTTKRAIVVAFKGAHGDDQNTVLSQGESVNGTIPFFNNGRVMQVYLDSFMALWNGGIQQDLRRLIYLYPNYELWVNGHSLGAAMATLASAYIVKSGLFKSENMKVVTLGTPSVGDLEFAMWHYNTFVYSFHIVHRYDPVPKNSVLDTVHNITLYHQRTLVWYDNYMRVGDPYIICLEADGPYCDGLAIQNNSMWQDHLYYFNILLPDWGHAGCPKNISAYQQP